MRMQFAFAMSFHIVFACFSIGLASILVLAVIAGSIWTVLSP
jgi:cytochrome bd-type quinol oxidase subunit 1